MDGCRSDAVVPCVRTLAFGPDAPSRGTVRPASVIGSIALVARRARRLLAYFRLRPFDTSTQEGRAHERYRRVVLTAAAAAAARSISLLTFIVSVPLAVGYLGVERYGVVVTITALTSMLVFADFGLGNGLMNLVAAAAGRGNTADARRSIASAFYLLCGIALLVSLPLALLHQAIPWVDFMNFERGDEGGEIDAAIAVFMALVVANLPLGVVQRIQLALQQGYVNSLWNALGGILALAVFLIAIAVEASLAWVVGSLLLGPIIGNALNSIHLFATRRELRPRLSDADWARARELITLGGLFFVLQLTVAVAYQADVVVATRVIGPAAAGEYSIVLRLFLIVPMLVNMLLLPLWPAYSEAIGRGDGAWISSTLKRSLVMAGALTAGPSLLLLLAAPAILQAWTGADLRPDFMLLLGAGVWAVVSTGANAAAMLLNGASVMKLQLFTAIPMAIASPIASIVLASQFGLPGVIWGTILAYVVCTGIPLTVYLPRVVRSISSAAHGSPS